MTLSLKDKVQFIANIAIILLNKKESIKTIHSNFKYKNYNAFGNNNNI